MAADNALPTRFRKRERAIAALCRRAVGHRAGAVALSSNVKRADAEAFCRASRGYPLSATAHHLRKIL